MITAQAGRSMAHRPGRLLLRPDLLLQHFLSRPPSTLSLGYQIFFPQGLPLLLDRRSTPGTEA